MRKAHASEHESEVATMVLPRENERGHSLLNLFSISTIIKPTTIGSGGNEKIKPSKRKP
jgi:hypothetical protein